MAISGAWTVALSRGWPLQGGIDVGISTKLPGGEIYDVVQRTYLLKHGIAGWPRIAIGNKFVSYIRFVQAQSEDRPGARIAASIAKLCSQMVREDTQHQPYLDCLGAPAHQFLGAGMHPILSIPFTLSLMQKNDDGSQTEMLKLSVDIIYSNCILNRVLPFGASSGLV